ncbi:hypothetical protein ILYODFUR_018852 [Ilyodon furcidens]|uniref:Vomeronasal type-1 receptor n=1 Tax=Ilyodon furcidens TaxID=33524 RepID=A0ABV0TJR2_9TELE
MLILSVADATGLKKPVELRSVSFLETCLLTITQAVMIFHVQVLDSSLRTSSSGSRLYHFSKAAFILWGMLTSFAKQLINSLSTLFPEKSVFTVQAKHRFILLLFGFTSPYQFQRRCFARVSPRGWTFV